MRNLVPTSIVDKNGKATTVHKKVAGKPSKTSLLSAQAPTLSGSQKRYYPTHDQTLKRSELYPAMVPSIAPELRGLLPDSLASEIEILASDVDIYKTLAKVDTLSNALACLHLNQGEPKDKFFKDNGVEHLLNQDPDRVKIMRGALERGIPATRFVSFASKYESHQSSKAYLDAASVYQKSYYERIEGLSEAVLREEISYGFLKQANPRAFIHLANAVGDKAVDVLQDIERGHANYTLDHLHKAFLRKPLVSHPSASANARKREIADVNKTALELMDMYGGEYVSELHDLKTARNIYYACISDGVSEVDKAISYVDDFRKDCFRNYTEVYNLFRAGVDREFAMKYSQKVDEYSVSQITAMYEGVPKPITSGWL